MSAAVCVAQTGSALQIGEATASKSQLERIFGEVTLPETADKTFFEGPVNPQEYLVGPGDKFKIYYWKPTYTEYTAYISAEGDLVIPLVGAVRVAEMTLAEAQEAVHAAVDASFKKGAITVTLVVPRKFRIHVTGQVNTPGTYLVPATARVSDAITIAEGLKRERDFSRGDTAWTITASKRRIELRSAAGEQIGKADMLLFLQGGKLKANPLLTDGVTVHVPYPCGSSQDIGVFGAVNAPGMFEYVEDDELGDALALAGGFTDLADGAAVRVVSERTGDEKFFDLSFSGTVGWLTALHPGDRVYIAGRPDTSRSGSVTLKGQVARPGGYPIVNGVTTLAEVLETAGGLLPGAAATSARLVRHNQDLTTNERFRISASDLRSRPEPVFPADPELAAEFARWDYGTVVIDLTGDGEQGAARVVLHDGDVLEVPSEPLGVRVLGFVNSGGEVAWIAGGRLNDYLRLAGGANRGGWKNRTVVIKAKNGSQIWYGSSVSIDPGDVIFVPSKPETTNWERFKDVVSVTAQLATLALVIQNVSK